MLAALTAGLVATGAQAAVDIEGTSTRIGWSPASGPVAGYAIYVSFNDGPYPSNPYAITLPNETQATIVASVGDEIRVRVAAFDDAGNFGNRSDRSSLIRFVKQPNVGGGGGNGGGGGSSITFEALTENDPNGGFLASWCGEPPDLSGKERVRVKESGRDPVDDDRVGVAVSYCDGNWAITTNDGKTLSGRYERIEGKGRRLRFYLDNGSVNALMNDVAIEAAQLSGQSISPSPDGPAKMRLRIKNQQVKLYGRIRLLDESGRKFGFYRLKAKANLE